ncbi:pilus assembly protein TadG-related protein [Nocardioides acrostichi]|uniref:pilus assembly protein TadG-related protein n=1 Tax=Nocardioides acrostichi TaxID=2784339 RepID=UPI002E288575|nr:pilus assembly protein TadG-related protein [Nocardioides acrostichi]
MRRQRDEQGAVAVFLAVTVTLLLVMASFAVDLGMQRVARRDMQALADSLALSLGRELDGKTQAELAPLVDQSDAGSELSGLLRENDDNLGDDLAVQVSFGSWNGSVFDASIDPPTAVRVTASSDVGFVFSGGSGAATRTAYAEASSTACYEMGSIVAAVESGNSALLAPLNSLLGLNLSLAGYRGLADVKLSVADLVQQIHAGDPAQALSEQTSVGALLEAAAAALSVEQPSGYQAAVSTLGAAAAASSSLPAVSLGSILSMSSTDQAALETDLSVLDMLAGSIMVANGQHALAIPNLQAGVPGVGAIKKSTLSVISGARVACGEPFSAASRSTSSQLTGALELEFANLPTINLNAGGLVKGTLQTAKATGVLAVDLGGADGVVTEPPPVHCGAATVADPDRFGVAVSTDLMNYSFGSDVEVSGKVSVGSGPLKVAVDVTMTVHLQLSSSGSPSVQTADLGIPPNDVTPWQGGSPVVLSRVIVPTITSSSMTVGGLGLSVSLPLGIGAASVTSAIQTGVIDSLVSDSKGFGQKTLVPLVDNIDSMLIGPIVELLGLRLAGADVYAVNTVCGVPALRG